MALPVACAPSYLNITGHSRDWVITVSRNGGDFVTFDSALEVMDWDAHYNMFYLGQDGVSYAFIDHPWMVVGMDDQPGIESNATCGINKFGEYVAPEGIFNLLDKELDLEVIYQPPHTAVPEVNWITVKPTPNVDRVRDSYYQYEGSDTADSITIYSCAVLALGAPAPSIPVI